LQVGEKEHDPAVAVSVSEGDALSAPLFDVRTAPDQPGVFRHAT